MAKIAFTLDMLTDDQRNSLKPYEIGLDEDGQPVSKFKYFTGKPRQYRFDAKEGKFKLNLGGDNLKDIGRSLTIRPLAWRIFYDPNLFNMGAKTWAELFFINDQNAVSAVLFHGFSVQNLEGLIEPLFYDDLNLSDVVLTITAEKKSREDGGTYYIANFNYDMAPPMESDLVAFLADTPIYRAETLSDVAEVKLSQGMAYTMLEVHAEPAKLEAPAQS